MLHISKWERHSNGTRDALGTAAFNLCKNASPGQKRSDKAF